MSGRSTKLSVTSGSLKTPKARSKMLSSPSPPPSLSSRSRRSTSSGGSDLAPAAVSRSRRMSYSYSSSTIEGMAGVAISATIPLCEVGNDHYNNGLYVQGLGTNAAFTTSVCDLNPYEIHLAATAGSNAAATTFKSGSWISPHVPLLAIAFDRYAMRGLAFHYEPQSTSTTDDRLVFAFTDDPSHPFLSAFGVNNASVTSVPSQLELLVTKDSVAFMPWKQWSISVPVSKEPKFLFDQFTQGGSTSAAARFYNFGSFSCVGSAAPSTPMLYGILYATIHLVLFDPVPIVSSLSSGPLWMQAVRSHFAGKRLGRRPAVPPLPPPPPAPVPREESKDPVRSPSDDGDLIPEARDRYVICDDSLPLAVPKLSREPGYMASSPAPPRTAPSTSSVPLSLRGTRQ